MRYSILIALAACALAAPAQTSGTGPQTRIGTRGSLFTINGKPTYTAEAGFPNADTNLIGTLLNVRAVQAIFDDANYPGQGSRSHPYSSNTMGEVAFEYPDTGKWDPERNTNEFIAALPSWRRCGLTAFTVNLQGGGPTDGNYGESGPTQPHLNSGFDETGKLKPAYAKRLERVIAAADRQGMVVIVGFFYQGEDERIRVTPDNRYVKEAIVSGLEFLKSLPYRNMLVEINNETSVQGYTHPILQPNGAVEAVKLAKSIVGGTIPVSMSWSGGIQPRGSKGDEALREVDYVMFHTNGQTPEQVHETIAAMHRWVGFSRPLLINEDGVSPFNLHAAAQEHVGWGYYDQGWNNYVDGFQSPPTNWSISTPVKWLFFEQVAKLTGSTVPPRPRYESKDGPVVRILGLEPGQRLKGPAWIEAVVEDRHARWPIKRVEFYIDGKPYSYRNRAPFMLGGREWWTPAELSAGEHMLRVVAFDMRGPRFTEACSIVEVPFTVEKQPDKEITLKHAIITAFLGRLRDRFCDYQEPLTLVEKLERMSAIPGVSGAEVVFPYEVDPPEIMMDNLRRLKLEVSTVNVNVKADPAFIYGSLSSPDAAVRAKALDLIKGAKDYAKAIGVNRVTCCPLSDGYDYSFHTHYIRAWERMVNVVREAAAYLPDITLLMEYKPSETRVHCLLDSAAKTLLLCSAVGGNVGVTLDVGHSIYGGETPAEALAHCAMSGFPYYVHINDNNGKWDWDLMAGTCNLWLYVEFLFWLKELGYDGWITSDTSPVRQDPIETFAFNVRFTNRILAWLDTIDREFVREHLEKHEYMPIMKLFEPALFAPALAGQATTGK